MRKRSGEKDDRDKRKTFVLEGSSPIEKALMDRFSTIVPNKSQDTLELALEIFWEHFPKSLNLDDKVGNTENPGDGMLYNADHVAQANTILKDFVQAWRKIDGLAENPPPPKLEQMGKICLIVAGMQQQGLLLDFIGKGLSDSDLRLDRQKLDDIFTEEHRPYAASFYTEQYRVIPREWKEGSHGLFYEGEPMPLEFVLDEPLYGSFGNVIKVRDPYTRDLYVRKQHIIWGDENKTQSCRNHIEQERQRLKGLSHRHVIKLVKSYERGKVFGLVLKPAANSDLGRLLKRFKDDKFNPKTGCNDSIWLSPVFQTAFGCLAQGLAYIHGRNLRHKDVKPDNILFEQSSDRAYNILWADFGLAYDFSDKEDSKTRSTKLYSPRYAPPEVVAANARGKAKPVNKLEAIEENGETMLRAEMDPKASDEEIEAHGRAADEFALGCIYLELLGRLTKHDLPLHANHDNRVMFSENIDGLCTWAVEKTKGVCPPNLRPLFDIAVKMIQRNPDDRPGMNVIIDAVLKAGKEFACNSCWNEYSAKTNMTPSSPTSSPTSIVTPRSSQRTLSGRMLNRSNSGKLYPTRRSSPHVPRVFSVP